MDITLLTRTTLLMLEEAFKAGMAVTPQQKQDTLPEALAQIAADRILSKYLRTEDHHTTTIG